ncbi:hypothetical protein TPHA_0C03780 [Tetrapisispora phaffii CBS 4417]|uniref:Protein farnesyltransferase subunit beta n=1 Tax=Tetrapisispora phaffii (strain ATCC 24235 / CBS 4417 / NBRC 1672 / NRRL Y-8282 / UCD 70-5) TaxID=1071381 RepID=G8BQL8_TETPH|nr:hypothetical protein TPHA_0C03780 [Tetrapisispora phaffii CBS 4417]CCE62530.1 hypothetical protein TPHA_0C03780 [Tetrapisispora phaffii CBS 4417]
MERNLNRFKFINNKLLGRKKPIIERELSSEEEMDVISDTSDYQTETIADRNEVLKDCLPLLEDPDLESKLNRDFLKMYLTAAFSLQLPSQMTALDASQPWILYWVANSLYMLDAAWLTDDHKKRLKEKIFVISPDGGPFAGGIGQLPHVAATYAAINTLTLCDNIDNSWDLVNRDAILNWLLSIKQKNGGFKTSFTVGENDTRGVYCALSIASLLNIITPELTENVLEYLIACQNFEGGFGGCPQEDEAHGGYTFCAVAALAILGKLDSINIPKLIEWCATKQYNEEKGFCGRSNKLVDGCYSFWVGGTIAILEAYGYGDYIFDHDSLREYILRCCQDDKMPGLRDKPGKRPDFYHTNYVLSGLAITEYKFDILDKTNATSIIVKKRDNIGYSELNPVNPIYGIPIDVASKIYDHFR